MNAPALHVSTILYFFILICLLQSTFSFADVGATSSQLRNPFENPPDHFVFNFTRSFEEEHPNTPALKKYISPQALAERYDQALPDHARLQIAQDAQKWELQEHKLGSSTQKMVRSILNPKNLVKSGALFVKGFIQVIIMASLKWWVRIFLLLPWLYHGEYKQVWPHMKTMMKICKYNFSTKWNFYLIYSCVFSV